MTDNLEIGDIAMAVDPTFESNGIEGGESEFVLYTVDDDIVPRQFRRFDTNQHQDQLIVDGGLYENFYVNVAVGGWSDKIRNTSGVLLTYVIPVLIVAFFVGALLTVIPLRRLYSTVLSTSFYVFVSLLVDSCVLLLHCGSEWLRITAVVDLRMLITGSSAVLCKIYPFVMSFGVQLSSWLTVVMAAETAWIYQRPQRLTNVCRLQRARRVLGGLLIVLGLSNIHLLWTSTIHFTSDVSRAMPLTELPVCIDRLSDPRAIVFESIISETPLSWDRNVARLIIAGFRFAISQLLPYFVVFSCAVMLVTKRWKRRDQLRQVDNTWKACNVDATAGRQMHTAFAVICVIHSVALLPRLAYDSFQFINDPQLTGNRTVSYRPASVFTKTVVYMLHYAFIAARPYVLLVVCPLIRRSCANDTVSGSELAFCCSGIRGKKKNYNHRPSPSSISGDGSFAGGNYPASTDHVTMVGEPLLQKSAADGNTHHSVGHHVTFNELMKSDDSVGSKLLPPAPPPPVIANTASIVLENGAPCIKIFSMTSV